MISMRKRAMVAPIALAAAIGLTGCGEDSAGPEQGDTVEDVAEAEPDDDDTAGNDLLGQDVTVSGEITEVVADDAFWLGAGGGWFEDGAPVVSTTGDFTSFGIDDPASLVDADTIVQVSGTVEEFVLLDFESEWGIDLDDGVYEDLEGEAVIVADDVSTLAGEDVTITGTVYDVLSTVSFQLAGAGWTVVVLDAEQAKVDDGDIVQVTGTVRQMNVAEIEDDYGVDLDDELYADYEGDLVLVANTIEPVAEMEPSSS